MNISEINNNIIQVFTSNVKKVHPIGNVSLARLLNAVGNMKPELFNIYDQIKQAEKDGDIKKKHDLKMQLYYFTPCVILDPQGRRSYKDIQQFTGFMHLDFDHIDNVQEFKYYLFEKYDFIIAAWLSASRKGIKCLVSIPIADSVKQFKAYFWGLAGIMNKYKGFDTSPQNAVLPLFLSPDENILIAEDFTTWTKTGINPKDIQRPIARYKYEFNSNSKYKDWAISNIQKAIDKVVDNGHPQLRAAAYSLGGYVSGGYVPLFEAQDIIENMIRANSYLSKKANIYIKTSRTMIIKGQQSPLFF